MFLPYVSRTSEKMVPSKVNGYKQSYAQTRSNIYAKLWKGFRLNEWTFSLSLVTFTLSVALGKLCINYGYALWWPVDSRYALSSLPDPSQLYSVSDTLNMKKLLYEVTEKWGWLMKAFLCGLAMTGFTWCIIYNDSYIPGVNPPFLISPSKQRYRDRTGLQLNYLVGLLNGILIFLYMCS